MEIKELGHVVLYVRDVEASSAFYRETLGFKQIAKMQGAAIFSSGRTHHEMLLIEVGGSLAIDHTPKPGLYHIGFKIGDGAESLRAVYHELKENGVTIIGATDHGVTHSLYILDPDHNELELYADIGTDWREHPEAILARPKALNLF